VGICRTGEWTGFEYGRKGRVKNVTQALYLSTQKGKECPTGQGAEGRLSIYWKPY
jgi:hypothetical protein